MESGPLPDFSLGKLRRLPVVAGIRLALQVVFSDQRFSSGRDLDQELIVAHWGDDLLGAIVGVLAEHLARGRSGAV